MVIAKDPKNVIESKTLQMKQQRLTIAPSKAWSKMQKNHNSKVKFW